MDYSEIVRVTSSFDRFAHRDETRDLGSLVRKRRKGGTVAVARRLTNVGLAIAALILATIAFGLVIGPIGISGLFFVVVAMVVLAVLGLGVAPAIAARERSVEPYKEEMSNKAVVQRLGSLLSRHRTALPPAAGNRVDSIGAQLPMLESQLATLDPLNPLAQDARRLMGQHLPDLITRYEAVPAQYRRQRDGQGMSVNERLVAGLDAARIALDDLGRKLAQDERDAFETQGRFIESRYRDDGPKSEA